MPSLTGARFVAAGLVFFFHATLLFPFASPDAQENADTLFLQGGFTGVTFFFMLSGFVLTWSVRPGDTAPAFWRRRFFKVYPNHLLTFVAALVVLGLVTGATLDAWDGVLNVLLLQSWHPDLAVRTGFNVVAWSLSCEALFYFAFPFLIKLVDRVRPERLWLWTTLSAASVVSLPSFAALLPEGQPFPFGYSDRELWFVFHLPPTQLLTFVFGMFLARIVLTGRPLPLKLGGAVGLAVGAYFVAPLFEPLYRFSAVMLVPLGLLVAAAAVADVDRQPTFLGSKAMVWLGDVSFAFYMWHYLVLVLGQQWLGTGQDWSTTTTVVVMLLLFAVTLVLAWATFTVVERPMMKRFATSRRKREPVLAA
ncbi:acyltransferase [Saccharothrix mutabilis subsp. mutabilis]|uniref:Acyltransferase n=1 Tax=Saccharothrix mutabilis subsp. mutabilis TaxID=66855 RepID=A0ABN0UEP9_9PSEU